MLLRRDSRPFDTAAAAFSESGAYRPVSYWQETVAMEPGAALEGETTCDVVILGGGYTGLSCALELKRAKPSLDVVLLEQAVVGHGASGRNGGFAMPLLGWDLTDLVHKRGLDEAQSAYRLMYQAIEHLKRVVADEGIECDLESTGYLLIATCAKRQKAVRYEAELGGKLGFDHQYLSADEVRRHIRSDSFGGGVYDPHPCIVNPAKLARGLKAAVERRGVRVFERSPLVEFRDDDPVLAQTPRGAVRAKAAVLALNGYGGSLGFLRVRVLPVHTYIVLTEPLSAAQLDEIGWRSRTSLETARKLIHYFRLTADNRIAFGGEDAQLYWRGSYRDCDSALCAALERRFREFFPSLASVGFTHRWGGVLGVTIDMFPTFGDNASPGGRVFHACGYSGHGVALSNFAGRILAPRILSRLDGTRLAPEAPSPFFYNRLPPWLPPDPCRYVGMKAYRRVLQALDWWEGS